MRGALPANTLHACTALCSVVRTICLFSIRHAAAVALNCDFLKAFVLLRIKFRPLPLLRNETRVHVTITV
jgi:hypothetical protein